MSLGGQLCGMYLTATLFQRTLSPRASPFGNITMNVSHLLVLICFTQLLISSLCDTQDSVVEGSGEVLTHTDKVPVIEDELVTTRASTHKDLLPSHAQNPKSNDKVTVSDSYDNKETASLDIVFIIVPAVVGVAVIAAVIIGVVAIRRRGYQEKMVL